MSGTRMGQPLQSEPLSAADKSLHFRVWVFIIGAFAFNLMKSDAIAADSFPVALIALLLASTCVACSYVLLFRLFQTHSPTGTKRNPWKARSFGRRVRWLAFTFFTGRVRCDECGYRFYPYKDQDFDINRKGIFCSWICAVRLEIPKGWPERSM